MMLIKMRNTLFKNTNTIDGLIDTVITNPTNNQVLTYLGGNWVNSNSNGGVTSVFGRSGNVIAAGGDYSIGQITNASILSNSVNLNFSSLANDDYIAYNGTQFINKQLNGYDSIISANTSQTMILKRVYVAKTNPINLTLPTVNNTDIGKFIAVICADNNDCNVIVPNNIFVNLETNFTTSSQIGSIIFCVSGTNNYQIVGVSGNFTSKNGKKYIPRSLEELNGVLYNTLQVDQTLFFDGTNFTNSNFVKSFNSRVNNVLPQSGDYSIGQITNASILSNSANLNFTSLANNDYVVYNGAQFINKQINGYDNVNAVTTNQTMVLKNIYVVRSNPVSLTLPTCNLSDAGKLIKITTADNNLCNIIVPAGISVINENNFTISSSYGSIVFVCSSANQYQILSVYGNWSDKLLKLYAPRFLNDLSNVTITSVQNNDILRYNSGTQKWINSAITVPTYFNTAGQITINKIFTDSANTNGSGLFSFNISSAGFTNIFNVQATCFQSGTSATSAPFPSINVINTTTISGLTMRSNGVVTIGNGLQNAGAGITVYLQVMGN